MPTRLDIENTIKTSLIAPSFITHINENTKNSQGCTEKSYNLDHYFDGL